MPAIDLGTATERTMPAIDLGTATDDKSLPVTPADAPDELQLHSDAIRAKRASYWPHTSQSRAVLPTRRA